jgi:hypothetical protein
MFYVWANWGAEVLRPYGDRAARFEGGVLEFCWL